MTTTSPSMVPGPSQSRFISGFGTRIVRPNMLFANLRYVCGHDFSIYFICKSWRIGRAAQSEIMKVKVLTVHKPNNVLTKPSYSHRRNRSETQYASLDNSRDRYDLPYIYLTVVDLYKWLSFHRIFNDHTMAPPWCCIFQVVPWECGIPGRLTVVLGGPWDSQVPFHRSKAVGIPSFFPNFGYFWWLRQDLLMVQ